MILRKWKRKGRQKVKNGINWCKKHPDRTIALLSLFFTSLLSIAAVALALKGNNLNTVMLSLAKHQDRLAEENLKTSVDIQSFKSLLKKTNSILSKDSELVVISSKQIDTLVSLNKTLNSQLEVNKTIQEKQHLKDILEFKNIGQQLMVVVGYNTNYNATKWDSSHRAIVYNRAGLLLDKALDNPLAPNVDTLLRDLIISRDMIYSYLNDSENEKIVNYTYNFHTDSQRTVRKGVPEFKQFLNIEMISSNDFIGRTAFNIYKYASALEKKYRKNWVHTY